MGAGVDADGEEDELPGRRRRWPRMLGVLLILLLVALAGLWLARKLLASRYADRFLAEKGVPARYRIADLGLGRQRLVDVVLGDPTNPDLVADWLEARTAVGLGGPYLTGVRGGHVRLRARLVDGRVSLGSLDRLLPPPSGKAFTLPALDVAVADARVRLETRYGVAAMKVAGSGRLDGGFSGTAAVVSERLAEGGCGARGVRAVLTVRATGGAEQGVSLDGPVRALGAACGDANVADPRATVKARLLAARPSGSTMNARIRTGAVAYRTARARSADATVTLVHGGGAAFTAQGQVAANAVRGGGATARQVRLDGTLTGTPRAGLGFRGTAAVADADAAALLPRLGGVAAGTPVAPLIDRIATAAGAAARRFSGQADLVALSHGNGVSIDASRLRARSASGATAGLADGNGVHWGPDGLRLDGRIDLAGGALPTLDARVSGRTVLIAMQPYAAGPARLALTPVTVRRGAAGTSVRTVATLSGPLGEGRVDDLTLPIDLRLSGGGLALDPACVPLDWRQVAVSGLVLARGGVRLCPLAGPLLTVANGRVGGGARIGAARLAGRLGTTPLTLAAAGAEVRLTDRGFAVAGVEARLGRPGRLTRLDVARLDGRLAGSAVAGRFAGAGGQIGAVPLLLAEAGGDWRLAGGALTLNGGMSVSDAQVERPRFKPMPVRDVTLRLVGNAIAATGTVLAPGEARKVADVRLSHDLASGTGAATFTVPGLQFDKALQPDQLTPVTFGVIADVAGTVTGEGRIDWTPAGVTSTGVFRTAGTDLAAAFGPVQGIAGEIRFTDLLALESAPGQQVTVRSVNPGIAVTDGVVRFQTLPDSRVQVDGARWPFAGGTLTLDPTLLDFGQAAQRRMTFRVAGMAAGRFLQQFDFKNLDATGTFDGVLPMIFDTGGGRIQDGRLAVRPGGGTIAYVGPISQKDIGFWPNVAFQALKSLRYRNLAITMNGPLAGEMVTEVRFAGVSQGEGARRGGIAGLIVGRLQRLPFVFNIRIAAPFRGLLDATASFYDPRRLIQRNLPQLIEEQKRAAQPPQGGTQVPPQDGTQAPPQGGTQPSPPIQPPASRTVP